MKYKFCLAKDFYTQTTIYGHCVGHEYFVLGIEGDLLIKAGYAWNGATGSPWTPVKMIEATMVHDCLYQMRKLGYPINRKKADDDFYARMKKGQCRLAFLAYLLVRLFGGRF